MFITKQNYYTEILIYILPYGYIRKDLNLLLFETILLSPQKEFKP